MSKLYLQNSAMSTSRDAELSIDVVVVSYNNRDELLTCLRPLLGVRGLNVTVVDNGSSDGSPHILAELDVTTVLLERNHGFAYGCNLGWRRGRGRYVLFLNPDATISRKSLTNLVEAIGKPGTAAAAPKLRD